MMIDLRTSDEVAMLLGGQADIIHHIARVEVIERRYVDTYSLRQAAERLIEMIDAVEKPVTESKTPSDRSPGA